MKIRTLVLYMLLVVLMGGAFYAVSTIPVDPPPEEALAGRVAPLERIKTLELKPQYFEETILMPGMAAAAVDVDLAARIPGVIERIDVSEGDMVEQGQPLFEIDLRSRRSQLSDARAALELAEKTLERLEPLRRRGDVPAQEYDEAATSKLRAEALYERLQVEVSLGMVKAPVSGVIDRLDAEEGEYVHEGGVLARLITLDPIEVNVGVPERYADAVAGEDEAVVYIEALNETRTARLERVAFGADATTNTFEATLKLENPDRRIRPGMIVRVRLVTKRAPEALMAPLAALVKREAGMAAFIERDGAVELRPLELGAIEGDRVEVVAGLSAGDRIVVSGQQDLSDGQRVEVADALDADYNQPFIPDAQP